MLFFVNLIHIGLDTVELKGEGFTSYVEKGDNVKVGDKLLEVDLELLNQKNKPIISPIIITNSSEYKEIEKNLGKVSRKDVIMKIKK